MRSFLLLPLFCLIFAGCNQGLVTLNEQAAVIEGDGPSISTATAPVAGTYETSSVFTITMSDSVIVTGLPRIPLTVGTTTRYAVYDSSTSTNTSLNFIYTPEATDVDFDGIEVSSNIDLNGGTIKGTQGFRALLGFTAPDTSGMKVGSKVISLNFQTQALTIGDVTHSDPTNFDGWSFTRNSTSYSQNVAGTWVAFAPDVPRMTDKGFYIEGARTNKCTNFNANPVDNTNTTLSGDAAAVFSVVNDSSNLSTAGLSAIATSGNVYRVNNTSGVAPAYIDFAGQPGNTSAHFASIFVRGGTGALMSSSGATIVATTASASYTRFSATYTPSASTVTLRLRIDAGQDIYFLLNQYEQGTSVSSPIVVAGASATRPADIAILSDLSFEPSPFTINVDVDLDNYNAAGRYFFDYTDGTSNNRIIGFRSSTNRAAVQTYTSSGLIYQPSRTGFTGARTMKVATRYNGTSYNWAVDNILGTSSTQNSMAGPMTDLFIGQTYLSAFQAFGYIKKLELYQTSKTDIELQALTL